MSSRWSIAVASQVPAIRIPHQDDHAGVRGDSDGSDDEPAAPQFHVLLPITLLRRVLEIHSGSSTLVSLVCLALAVGVSNIHHMCTRSGNAKSVVSLARVLTPRVVDVFDFTMSARTSHRHDPLVMVRCIWWRRYPSCGRICQC